MSQYDSTKQKNGKTNSTHSDPEVRPKVHRRTFTTEYKLRILAEADRSRESGAIGAMLRREGLYSSHLTTWRRQREAGELGSGVSKKRGPKEDKQAKELAKLQRENERLRARLEQAELIIGAQKKLAQALEQALSEEEDRGL